MYMHGNVINDTLILTYTKIFCSQDKTKIACKMRFITLVLISLHDIDLIKLLDKERERAQQINLDSILY